MTVYAIHHEGELIALHLNREAAIAELISLTAESIDSLMKSVEKGYFPHTDAWHLVEKLRGNWDTITMGELNFDGSGRCWVEEGCVDTKNEHLFYRFDEVMQYIIKRQEEYRATHDDPEPNE